jgi:MATE family multidrug resistance protein
MSLFHESKLTLRLALPLMIGQLSQMLLGVADTLMVGHLGVLALATLTFANSLFYMPFVFGIGLLTSISVHSAHARGAQNPQAARSSCRHGLYISLALGLVFFLLTWLMLPHLGLFRQPAAVTVLARDYFFIIMASIVPALASIALKNHADAMNRPWPPFWIFLSGVLLNVLLNWVMINGKWGCPVLGMNGAAWATLISRMAILLAMFFWMMSDEQLRDWVPHRWLRLPVWREILHQWKIGVPASFQMLCEVGAFSAAGLMMGAFGEISMAAHQVAMTCASVSFMVPLGLSMALTVRTGEVKGSADHGRLRPVVFSGWLLAAVFSTINALIFFCAGPWLAARFVDDAAVITLASTLLVIVGVFQIVDGMQVASSSMLRGLQDARMPALMGFAAYWVIGLPVSAWLGYSWHMGASGVWWGLAAGLFTACVTLGPRLWMHLRDESM